MITDRKVFVGGTYEAVVIMNSDYYPFGMEMPGRHTNEGAYRFGYNGMELDNEAKGNGNSYTTEFRQYDPRLGRWLSLDPLMAKYPGMSPYCAFNNNPIFFTDPLGLEGEPATEYDKGHEVTGHDGGNDLTLGLGNQPTVSDQKYDYVIRDFGRDCDMNTLRFGQKADNLIATVRSKSPKGEPGIVIDYLDSERDSYVSDNYLSIFGESIAEVAKKAKLLFGDRKSKTTILNVHGYLEKTRNPDGEEVPTGNQAINNDRKLQIDHWMIKEYLSGNLSTPEIIAEIDGLVSLMNMTSKDFVLLACYFGGHKSGTQQMFRLFSKKVNSGATLYLNADPTTLKTDYGRAKTSHGPLTKTDYLKSGWVMIKTNGIVYLINNKENTGNLIFDAEGNPNIQIEKKTTP